MKPKITLKLTSKILIFKVRVQNKVNVKKVKTAGFLLLNDNIKKGYLNCNELLGISIMFEGLYKIYLMRAQDWGWDGGTMTRLVTAIWGVANLQYLL